MPAEVIAQTGPGATVAPTPKAAPVVAAPVSAAAPMKSPEVMAIEKQLADERRVREVMLAKQKAHLEGTAKKEREGLGPKLARLAEFEKDEQRAKLDPTGYLEKKYGKDWYEVVLAAKLNGGAPTADTVAVKLAEMEEKFESKLKTRDEEARAAAAERQKAIDTQTRREHDAKAGAFFSSVAAEYPSIAGLGTAEEVGKELSRRREVHYEATTKRDESGALIAHGEMLPLQKICELWEGSIVKMAERVAAHAKYAEKFAPKSAVVAPKDVGQPQRRTLSNDLTGSTPARSAPANDIERRERANAAYEAKSKRPL
jgi:hypothetical protein